jgi:exodeoxyribonuclease X
MTLWYHKSMSSYNVILYDTETTGGETQDRLCQIAYKLLGDDVIVDQLYKPPLQISIESMTVHHITEKMVLDKPPFIMSPEYHFLKSHAENPHSIFVAHNVKFDNEMMLREGIPITQSICTMRVARALDTEAQIPSYALQYLRYYLGIEVEAIAHDAKGDVLVLEKLFVRLLNKVMDRFALSQTSALEKMIDISRQPMEIVYFQFGKYKNRAIKEIAREDRGYLEWLLDQKKKDEQPDEDWIFTLTEALK